MEDFARAVEDVLHRTEPGELLTYSEVAAMAGHPGAARAVGRILARSAGLPWWRVVTRSGRLVPGHEHQQAQRLAEEGTPIAGGRNAARRALAERGRGSRSP